ncbi:MAG: endolytic transglycosylase MltG [Candidatus Saccharibacteria bacterium]
MSSQYYSNEYKVKLVLLLMVVLLAVSTAIGLTNLHLSAMKPASKDFIEVQIPNNSTTRQVGQILVDNRLVRSTDFFELYCRVTGKDGHLKAGYYRFSNSQTLPAITEDLMKGRTISLTITIPEGFTLAQIGDLLVNKHICTDEQWAAALVKKYDYAFLAGIPQRPNRLEGFLFPDTYQVQKTVAPEQVIELMLKRFEQVWDKRFAKTAEEKSLDIYKIITMASLVEKEAKVEAERARIAGVLNNRLKEGMPLQVDATILYSLGKHKERVTYADLGVYSPYNTYRFSGLPPGPIANPGAASISAAISPEKNDYLYYVAENNGQHHFSRTYQEHLNAKNRIRKAGR